MSPLVDGLAAALGVVVAVLAPIAAAAIDGRDRDGARAPLVIAARRAMLPAGALAAIALWLPAGAGATLLTLPYAIACGLLGLHGLGRIAARGLGDPAALATAGGLVLWPGGALWLVAHRAGVDLLGYPPLWVGLTAAHFHVAGAFLPIVVGRAVVDRGRGAKAVAIIALLAVPLTAAGIAGPRWLEQAAALTMAAAGLGGALVLLTTRGALARLAGAALIATMLLATQYASRGWIAPLTLGGLDPLTTMLLAHGALNLGGVALLGLLATVRAGPLPGHDRPPLSRVRGRAHVGPRFFDDQQVGAPRGLVDDLTALGHAGLDAAAVAPAIRDFYQRTAEHALIVRPTWRPGFRVGARLWQRVGRRLGQLELPAAAERGDEGITSRIVGLDPARDGRRDPRAWIRQYGDGRAMYVAAYATHAHAERAYMNIAFPLPGGSMTSVLRMDHLGRGVRVSTQVGGDAGIYFVLRVGRWTAPLRLPLSEIIDVWTADDPAAPADLRAATPPGFTTIARHRVWLCGVRFVTLDYAMRPRA